MLELGTFTGLDGSETENLIPPDLLIQVIDRWQRGPKQSFGDQFQTGTPVIPQIEAWARANNVTFL